MKRYQFKTKESKEKHQVAHAKASKTLVEKNRKKYELQNKVCPTCSKKIPYEKRMNEFCSRSCSAKFYNKDRIKRIKNENCLFCGKSLKGINGLKYCSKDCQIKYQRKQRIEKWKRGEISGNYKGKWGGVANFVRVYLFEKFSNKCAECNWSKVNTYSKHIPLEIEHIDGNYQNSTEENLTLLCPNCHSLTPTYKTLNKGNGRAIRRERYKKGKSF